HQRRGQRLVQIHTDAKPSRLSGDDDLITEVVGGIGEVGGEAVLSFVRVAAVQMGNEAPLLGRGRQAQASVGGNAMSVEENLQARVLLIEEDGAVGIAVEHYADSATAEVSVIRYLQLQIGAHRREGQKEKAHCRQGGAQS